MTPPPPADQENDVIGADAGVFGPGDRVAGLLPRPLTIAYDYRVPDGLHLRTGDIVRVPLGPSAMSGVGVRPDHWRQWARQRAGLQAFLPSWWEHTSCTRGMS